MSKTTAAMKAADKELDDALSLDPKDLAPEMEADKFKERAKSAGLSLKPVGKSPRVDMLEQAIKLTSGDRDREYGSPVKNMSDIAVMWSAYLQAKYGLAIQLVAEDVPHMLTLMKQCRTFAPHVQPDTYIDAACYEAIAGECRFGK